MANNCLVTTLKSTVNNSSLEKFGMFSVSFKQETSPTQDSRFIRIVSTEKNTISCEGGLLYNTYGGTPIGDSYTFRDADWSEEYGGYQFVGYISNNECKLYIPKYTFKYYSFNALAVKDIDILKFKYTLVTSFTGAFLTGNISDLPDNAIYLYINGNTKAVGKLSDLSSKTLITSINLGNTSITPSPLYSIGTLTALTTIAGIIATGSIEDFVAAQRTNGRTTCEGINCQWIGEGSITFNGAAIANKASATLSWDASTITYDGTTITA